MSLQEKPLPADDSAASLKVALEQRTRELAEAQQHQTATSEILASISGSMTDAKPVFDAIVRNLLRLFGTSFASVQLLRGGTIDPAADGAPGIERITETYRARSTTRRSAARRCSRSSRAVFSRGRQPARPEGGPADRARLRIQLDHCRAHDLPGQSHRRHRLRAPRAAGLHRQRSRADKGVRRPGGDRDRERAPVRGRTGARARAFETLDQQTATAEILKVIASSPTDVQPVFDVIAQSALRLFGGQSATVTRVVGDEIHLAALTAGNDDGIEAVHSSFPSPLSSAGIHSRVARSGQPAFRFDIENEPDVRAGRQGAGARARLSQHSGRPHAA